MKKRMIAGMVLLVLTISGCSAVSTAPTTINELAEETRAEAETDSTDSILSSESKETDAPVESKTPEETESPESAAAPEETASQPIAEEAPKAPEPAASVSSESKQPAVETTPASTEQPQTAQQELQATQQSVAETPPPAPPQPTAAPEETKPKTAYDYEFDIAAIKADCISIGQSMGLSLDSSLTPDNAAWWNPVMASQSCQGEALKQSLESYITFHTAANLGSYGMDEITDFNIYCEARGNGEYLIWEYQQQLRTSPSDLHSANGIDGDTYHYSLAGRPAESCYNWILSQMAQHYTIPSFTARSQSRASTYTLKYNPDTKKYSLTLTDTNNTMSDMRFSADGITVSRNGNQYTFTSDRMITSPVTVTAQKNVNTGCDDMLIWGCVGKQTMASGASDPVYFYLKIDTETYGTGHIQKTSEDGVVSGIKFAGAVYGIYNDGQLVDTYTTDENGQFTTKYYICGYDWTVREISPSEGYLLDTAVHKVGAEPELYTVERNSTANDVTEQVIKGNIAIIKHTDDGETQIETPETGAVFKVYLKSAGSYEAAKETERDILTCDENGFAQTKDMPYGIYTVKQTSGWEGRELMKPFDVFINKDGNTYRYLINNANFESYIKIVKKDAETGNIIPYAGAGFQIYDPSGNLVSMTFTYPEVTTIDTFYTTADGELITPQTLEYGTGYSLVEVQAPYGYVLNSEPVYFDVVQENSEEESGITVIEVVRSNMAQKGTVTVSKSGEVFSSVAGDKGFYHPLFAVAGLEGAVYEITAAEDIYTLDGTLRASKGEVVDTVTTGADGTAKSKELYLGRYEVKEATAPYGMVLNEEVHGVELVYAGQNIAVTETATGFVNERQRVEIDLVKSLETNEAYGIGKNGEIFDVTFGLYAAEDMTAADGEVIPADGLIEIVSLDENGKGTVKSDLPIGSYYVQEISTNDAYIISDQKYPVVFEYTGQDTAAVHISANEGNAIENEIIYGSVSGKKSDEDGKALGGALIGIFKTGTTEFTKETAIATTVSAEDGSFSFAEVPYGTWVIREIESPKGFVLSEEEIAVTISEVDEIVEIELVNYFIKGNIGLTKVDEDYPENKLSGAVFEVYSDTNGDGKLDKDDVLLGTMTELEGGVYQMKELRYGKYLVREKTAPTGFVLDENVYPVSIEENGKTYTVENKAGVGFINIAQKGSLKIVKTSSDGKVEGFSFRVTGVNYDQTFTTDKNGEILIENLRIGEYTVGVKLMPPLTYE